MLRTPAHPADRESAGERGDCDPRGLGDQCGSLPRRADRVVGRDGERRQWGVDLRGVRPGPRAWSWHDGPKGIGGSAW